MTLIHDYNLIQNVHRKKTMKIRRSLSCLLLSAMMMCGVIAAEPWPNHTIKFVVGFGPGGANDLVARVAAEAASKQ